MVPRLWRVKSARTEAKHRWIYSFGSANLAGAVRDDEKYYRAILRRRFPAILLASGEDKLKAAKLNTPFRSSLFNKGPF